MSLQTLQDPSHTCTGAQEAPGAALKQPAPQAPAPAKPTQAVTKPGKRRGPLPLWLVEMVVIAAVPGLLYALLRWETQVRGQPSVRRSV